MNAFNSSSSATKFHNGSRQDTFRLFQILTWIQRLKLNQAHLPDEPDLLVRQLRCSFSDGILTFVLPAGIGATPDDHTRQAAAAALELLRRPPSWSRRFIGRITRKRGEPLDLPNIAQRLKWQISSARGIGAQSV